MTVARSAIGRKQDAGLVLGSGCKIGTFLLALYTPSPSDHPARFARECAEVGASCPSGGQGQSFPLRFPREGPPVLAQTSPWSSGRVPVSVPSLEPLNRGRGGVEAAKPTCALLGGGCRLPLCSLLALALVLVEYWCASRLSFCRELRDVSCIPYRARSLKCLSVPTIQAVFCKG